MKSAIQNLYFYNMILVTGATGFLGSNLLLQLTSNNAMDQKIVALYRSENRIDRVQLYFKKHKKAHLFEQIIWKEADILDIPALELVFKNISFVYHCAALVSFDPVDEVKLRKVNIEGTANIVNCCLDYNIEKLCFVSSIAALGDVLPSETIVNEKTEWNPELEHSDYAISKFGAEMDVWRAQQEGLKVIVVNPGVILGDAIGGDWLEGSTKIFETVSKGLQFYTKGSTGFVAIADVTKLMQTLMESDIVNQKFILVAENWSYESLTKCIAQHLQVVAPKYEVKKWQTNVYWRLDWLFTKIFFKERTLSKAMAVSLQSTDFYDNKKIKKVFGFEFEPLEKTLQKTCASYLKRLI